MSKTLPDPDGGDDLVAAMRRRRRSDDADKPAETAPQADPEVPDRRAANGHAETSDTPPAARDTNRGEISPQESAQGRPEAKASVPRPQKAAAKARTPAPRPTPAPTPPVMDRETEKRWLLVVGAAAGKYGKTLQRVEEDRAAWERTVADARAAGVNEYVIQGAAARARVEVPEPEDAAD